MARQQDVMDDSGAFRQRIRMAAVQVAGLRPDEIAAALAYEVEPFSGIPAAEADLAYVPVADPDPSVRVYDVAVRRRGAAAADGATKWLRPIVALAALAAVGIAADFAFLSVRIRSLERDTGSRAVLQARLDAVSGEARLARDEARRLREGREAAARAQDEVSACRAAYAQAMEAIATAFGRRAVLRSMSGGALSLRIRGVAASAAAASDALVALAACAGEKGWRMKPGEVAVRAPAQTAEFTCEIEHD